MIIRSLIVPLISCNALLTFAQEGIKTYKENGKYGFVSEYKKTEALYDKVIFEESFYIDYFESDVVFLVKKDGLWGLVLTNEELTHLIPCSYSEINFNEEHQLFTTRLKKGVGLLSYERVFEEDTMYIHKTELPPIYKTINLELSEKYFTVKSESGWGIYSSLINDYESNRFEPIVDCVLETEPSEDFLSGEYSEFLEVETENKKVYLLSANGSIISFDEMKADAPNELIWIKKGSYIGLLDEDSSLIARPWYDHIEAFMSGWLFVSKEDGKYGIFTRDGRMICYPKYEDVQIIEATLDGGIYAYKKDGYWGVNHMGRSVLKNEFDEIVFNFPEIRARKGEKWEVIDY